MNPITFSLLQRLTCIHIMENVYLLGGGHSCCVLFTVPAAAHAKRVLLLTNQFQEVVVKSCRLD